MSAERTIETQICPYWQRYFIAGENVLVLCGIESLDNFSLPNDEGVRLSKCPFYGDLALGNAYRYPQIKEFFFGNIDIDEKGEIELGISPTGYYINGGLSGKAGITQLEQVWDQEVDRFIERHSK